MEKTPTIRLHLWLETENGLFFGPGRALILEQIEKHGSLKKAAENMHISYRAAWGKIKKTEAILGFPLIEKTGAKKDGFQLTAAGKELMEQYYQWLGETEKAALSNALKFFSFISRSYRRVY